MICRRLATWRCNEYFDVEWDARSRPTQERLRQILHAVAPGAEREVLATNLVFFSSADLVHLPTYWTDAAICWPVHDFLLDIVRPRLLVA